MPQSWPALIVVLRTAMPSRNGVRRFSRHTHHAGRRFGNWTNEPTVWMYGKNEDAVVDLHRYRQDFQVVVDQLRGSGQIRTSFTDHAVVHVRPYKDFVKWARQQPSDDRHWTDGIYALVKLGLLPEVVVQEERRSAPIYDTPGIRGYLQEAGLTREDVLRVGLDSSVASIADAISGGQDIPPLVTSHGKPVDGRHRALAALSLGLTAAPVMEIAETF